MATRVVWRPSYRLVSSVFPPVGLFDEVASPDDLEVIYAVEGLTNPRLRDEIGALPLVPTDERIVGPGTTPIIAAFTHINREGSRFADGTYGVYYAARHIDTAIAETVYHRERFLAFTGTFATEIDMRCYCADIDARFTDIRGQQSTLSAIYDPKSYSASQAFARKERSERVRGIVYSSVRHQGGECVAAFWPRLIKAPVIQGPHFAYVWHGTRISKVYEKSHLREV